MGSGVGHKFGNARGLDPAKAICLLPEAKNGKASADGVRMTNARAGVIDGNGACRPSGENDHVQFSFMKKAQNPTFAAPCDFQIGTTKGSDQAS